MGCRCWWWTNGFGGGAKSSLLMVSVFSVKKQVHLLRMKMFWGLRIERVIWGSEREREKRLEIECGFLEGSFTL